MATNVTNPAFSGGGEITAWETDTDTDLPTFRPKVAREPWEVKGRTEFNVRAQPRRARHRCRAINTLTQPATHHVVLLSSGDGHHPDLACCVGAQLRTRNDALPATRAVYMYTVVARLAMTLARRDHRITAVAPMRRRHSRHAVSPRPADIHSAHLRLRLRRECV